MFGASVSALAAIGSSSSSRSAISIFRGSGFMKCSSDTRFINMRIFVVAKGILCLESSIHVISWLRFERIYSIMDSANKKLCDSFGQASGRSLTTFFGVSSLLDFCCEVTCADNIPSIFYSFFGDFSP